MNMKKKNICYYILILTTLILVLSTGITYAETNSDNDQEYGKAYQEWLKLPETEKEKTLTPRMYDIPFSSLELKAADEQLESKYNLADHIDITVEDQGLYGLCWSFATTKAMETNLALTKGEYYDFSEMYLGFKVNEYNKLNNNNHDSITSGGIFQDIIKMQKEKRFKGPVLESEVPYRYIDENIENAKKAHVVKKIKEYIQFPSIYKEIESQENIEKFRKEVKNHIKKYGSIYASIKIAETESDYKKEDVSTYFNEETNALCYKGKGFTNHAISIVGWDDNYPKENFAKENRPENDGAYIALNSWGEHWGNSGYFYISYEDVWVEQDMNGIIEMGDSNEVNSKTIKENNTDTKEEYEIRNVNSFNSDYDTIKDNTIYISNMVINNQNNFCVNLNEIDLWACKNASIEIYDVEYCEEENDDFELKGGVAYDGKRPGKLLKKVENCQEGLNKIEVNLIADDCFEFVIKYTGEYLPVQKYENEETKVIENVFAGTEETLNRLMWEGIYLEEYYYPIILHVADEEEEEKLPELKLGNMTPKNVIDGEKAEKLTFKIPISIEDSNEVNVKIYKDTIEVTNLFTINKIKNALNITNNTIETGEYLIEVLYAGGKSAYKVINILAPLKLESLNAYYENSEEKWKYCTYVAKIKTTITLDNIKITKNGEEVNQKFENLKVEKSTYKDDLVEIRFERKLSDKISPGEYQISISLGTFNTAQKFEIKEDQIINVITCYEESEEGYPKEEKREINEYTILLKEIGNEKIKFLNGYKLENFLELENGKLYEIRIYENLEPQLIKQDYYSYAKLYIYKDENGKKYFRTSESGENLENMEVKIYNANGTEMLNKSNKIKAEFLYDAIQITDETIPIIWGTTYNTYELSIYDIPTKKDFIENYVNGTGIIDVINQNGTELKDPNFVGTGMKIKHENEEWTIIIRGDLDGNGEFTVTDIAKQKLNLVEQEKLTGEYEIATDYNQDGKVTLTDLSQMKTALVDME